MARESRMRKVAVAPTRILPVLILAVLCGMAAFTIVRPLDAQQPAQGQQPSGSDQKAGDSQEPIDTLKVNVNVVQLFFNVKDKHGALIPNLTKEEFQIAEDGAPQTIKYFKAETDLPLTLGILIDSSGSQLR